MQRPLGGGRRASPRIVERQERRRATERCRHRILEEPVRVGVGGDPRVRVDVHRAGQHEQPGRVDVSRADARSPLRSGSIAAIRPPLTATSARCDPAAVTTVAPTTSRSGDAVSAVTSDPQPTSRIVIGCAPSHRQRRPTSRSRSAQPSSGSTVAKWFAASWPTFDAVVHPPYGKKISHSLMPPG